MVVNTIKCPHNYVDTDNNTAVFFCPGSLELVRLITDQVVYYCTCTAHIWYGTKIPHNDTPCVLIERYYDMLGINDTYNNSRNLSVKQDEHKIPLMEWDVEQFFAQKREYKLSRPKNTLIVNYNETLNCPICSRYKDDHVLIGPRTIEIIQIPKTNQLVPYCRTCNTVWSENSTPLVQNHGGKLDFYLAMLGIIQYKKFM
jgi:hypothetical protein